MAGFYLFYLVNTQLMESFNKAKQLLQQWGRLLKIHISTCCTRGLIYPLSHTQIQPISNYNLLVSFTNLPLATLRRQILSYPSLPFFYTWNTLSSCLPFLIAQSRLSSCYNHLVCRTPFFSQRAMEHETFSSQGRGLKKHFLLFTNIEYCAFVRTANGRATMLGLIY